MSFADRFDAAQAACGNPCLVGLDPHLDLLPAEFAQARDAEATRGERARAVAAFCFELIDICAGRVAAVKPQAAFFEQLGADGAEAWEAVICRAHGAGLLVVGDVKRGDIASTAAAYATAHLSGLEGADPAALCDAITVNPYLGDDSIEPFLAVCRRTDRGIFVLVRTSNPGSGRFQLHGSPPLATEVAHAVADWGKDLVGDCGLSSVGAVVGATHPGELRALREWMPRTPLLVPGLGAQGGAAGDVADAFLPPDRRGRRRGASISSSRAIAFAFREPAHAGKDWKDAARDALDSMIAEVTDALAVGV